MIALLGAHYRRCSLKTKKVAIENKTKENSTKDQWTLCMFTDVTAKKTCSTERIQDNSLSVQVKINSYTIS